MNNMDETKKLIYGQISKYPKLQPQDIVKAMYQSEFGCSHFIDDEEKGMNFLLKEIALNDGFSGDENFKENLVEEIGENFCRINIRKIKKYGLSPETLFKLFKITSEIKTGDKDNFLSKLSLFENMCLSGDIDFNFDEVRNFISNYKKSGCPAVHHSENFREIYKPAYRVVDKKLCNLLPALGKIDTLICENKTFLIAIDGGCASGKTTFAEILENIYDCNVFHMDNFFLRPHQRTKERFQEPGGNVDYERFYEEVIKSIATGDEFSYYPYDCRTQSLCEGINVQPKSMNIVEGVYSMHPMLRNSYDFSVFMKIDEKCQRERILVRNGIEMQKRFIEEWIPLENRYFEELKIEEKCDMILNGGRNFESNCYRRTRWKDGASHCRTHKKC